MKKEKMLVNLVVKDGRCRSEGNVGIKFVKLRTVLEGGCRVAKDGSISFAESGHNLDMWKQVFPDSDITKHANLDDQFASLAILDRPKFQFKRDPLWWQASANEKLKTIINTPHMHKAFAFFYDPGAGKSKSLTDMNSILYCEGEIDASIILTPNVLVGDQWSRIDEGEGGALQRDIHESIPYKSWLWKKTKKAIEEYEFMTSYNGLQTIVMNIDAAKTPSGYKLLDSFIKLHKGRVNFGIDEAHMIGEMSSQRHKSCVALGNKCRWKSVLTGTPITKNLISVFGIFKFLNPAIIGYKFVTGFKRQYCETKWNGFADKVVGHKNIEDLYQKIEAYSSRVSQKEMGLEKVHDEFVFDMSPEQRKHYDKVKNEWLTKFDNGEFASATIALTAALKLQQISNGFVVTDEGNIQLFENARMTALNAYLETLPEDEKVVIWCRFKKDAELLMNNFGKNAVDLSGNVSVQEKVNNKDKFIADPKIIYCVATPDSAGTGTDGLQNVCNRAIYYSSSEHYVNRKQSEDRILRVGGGSVAYYVDLICRGSPDRKILRNLKEKRDLSTYTLDSVRELFE